MEGSVAGEAACGVTTGGAVVGAGSGVMNNVKAGQTVLGYPAREARDMLKQWVAMRKLV